MLGAIRPTGTGGGGGGAVASVFGRTGTVSAAANDYTSNQITGLGGTAGNLVITPRASQTLTAASTIAIGSGTIPITAATPIALTSNPQIAGGTDGQLITIVNIGSNAITLNTGNGLLLQQAIVLYGGRSLQFVWSGVFSSWILTTVIPESLSLTGVPIAPTAGLNTASTQLATTAYVNQSNRPFLSAVRSGDQAGFTNNAFTKIIYNSETTDTNNIHDSSTGIITIPSNLGGTYQFAVSVFQNAASSVLAIGIFNAVSNIEIARIATFQSGSDNLSVINGAALLQISGSAQIDIRFYQSNSATTTRSIVANNTTTFLSMYRVNT